ncbi:hypothetical protein [Parafrankia sp. FMc2]|uniref:hypothetical protein n=1 Tax=Parafrankia sp. FMc2 TaxID=3233196 RepID=UPI0034D72F56
MIGHQGFCPAAGRVRTRSPHPGCLGSPGLGRAPGAFGHGIVGIAAAIAVDDQRQGRCTEEFRATLAEITGPLACPRRLWCALTILANAALLRAELGGPAGTGADPPPQPPEVAGRRIEQDDDDE